MATGDKSEELAIALAAHAAQLAVRHYHCKGSDVVYRWRAIGPGGIARKALTDRRHGGAHVGAGVSRSQLLCYRVPWRGGLHFEQAMHCIQAEDAVQARGIKRLAGLDGVTQF